MKKFFKDHGKKAGWIILAAIVLAILARGAIYTINEQEQAVVTTFGVAKAVTEPGLHVKIPFVQKVKRLILRSGALQWASIRRDRHWSRKR